MFDNYINDLATTEVTERGNNLLPGSGTVVITSFREKGFRGSPRGCLIEMQVLAASPKEGKGQCNSKGESVSKIFKFDDGDADKKAAVTGDFLKCVAAIASSMGERVDVKTFKDPATLKKALALAAESRGVVLSFDSYSSKTKKGEAREYHNLLPLPNTPDGVLKNRGLLDKKAPPSEFGA